MSILITSYLRNEKETISLIDLTNTELVKVIRDFYPDVIEFTNIDCEIIQFVMKFIDLIDIILIINGCVFDKETNITVDYAELIDVKDVTNLNLHCNDITIRKLIPIGIDNLIQTDITIKFFEIKENSIELETVEDLIINFMFCDIKILHLYLLDEKIIEVYDIKNGKIDIVFNGKIEIDFAYFNLIKNIRMLNIPDDNLINFIKLNGKYIRNNNLLVSTNKNIYKIKELRIMESNYSTRVKSAKLHY